MTVEQSGAGSASVLDEILAGVREDVERRQRELPLERVKELAAAAPKALDAYAALRRPGVWFLDGWVRIGSNGTFPQRWSLFITSDLFGPSAIPGSALLGNAEEDIQVATLAQQYNRVATFLRVTEASIATSNGYGLGIAPNVTDTFVIGQARLGAYFMREPL